MRRNTLNFLIDAGLMLLMFGMIGTGLVMRFMLPPGTGGRHGEAHRTLWGLGRHDWGDIHFWLAGAVAALLLVHVALHWAWVCGTARRFTACGEAPTGALTSRRRNLYGAGFLVLLAALFAGFVWIALASLETVPGGQDAGRRGTDREAGPDREDHREPNHRGAGNLQGEAWGAMTLQEVEDRYGVPAEVIRTELGLPDSVSSDQRLGRLRQRYDFRMSTLRRIIEQYQARKPPR